jgi:hypothetical protein
MSLNELINQTTPETKETDPPVHFRAFEHTSQYKLWCAKFKIPDKRPLLGVEAVRFFTYYTTLTPDKQKTLDAAIDAACK